MTRLASPFLAVASAAVLLAACGGTVGGLGPIGQPSASSSSLPPASPDVTAPASAGPSAAPSATPGGTAGPSAGPGSGSPSAAPSSAPSAAPTPAPTGTTVVRAYFHLGGDEQTGGLAPVLREVPETVATGRAALEQLLRGPSGVELFDGAGISTAIPDGTRLLGLSIEDGTATVDLSAEFEGAPGSASSYISLAQVVYTLTQFPTVDRVDFLVEGRDVTVFGSEGIVLDRPQTRADFDDQLPLIFVDRPAWGAALLNPGRISGTANVFEATFNVRILDEDGIAIAEQVVTATCGSGCRGTFDVTLPYEVDHAQWGSLETNVFSAEDGAVEMSRAYPVWLTPRG